MPLSENKTLFELARIVTDLLVSASCDGTLYALNTPPPPACDQVFLYGIAQR